MAAAGTCRYHKFLLVIANLCVILSPINFRLYVIIMLYVNLFEFVICLP